MNEHSKGGEGGGRGFLSPLVGFTLAPAAFKTRVQGGATHDAAEADGLSIAFDNDGCRADSSREALYFS
jgi:hypothetical protein